MFCVHSINESNENFEREISMACCRYGRHLAASDHVLFTKNYIGFIEGKTKEFGVIVVIKRLSPNFQGLKDSTLFKYRNLYRVQHGVERRHDWSGVHR